MTFAVVGILGHFSKTVLLFFIPQILNFLYSLPQLFHFIPCPRHRLPKYNEITNKLESSKTQFHINDINIVGKIFLFLFKLLRIIHFTEENKSGIMTTNNFTIINLTIIIIGPISEEKLTMILLIFQIICTCIAFSIRYPLASYFYDC